MLYIFDKDNTLVGGLGNRPANTPAEQQPLPGVVERLAALRAAGHLLAIASNQGGVAWGFISATEARALVRDAAAKVGGVDFWRCCCHDPRASGKPGSDARYARPSYRRKPAPGMLAEIAGAAGITDKAQIIFVGDAQSDAEAAERFGCKFVWASDFFGGYNA